MTNEEKYKTPIERYAKYRAFCKQTPGCHDCPAKMCEIPQGGGGCYFVWLTLEAEEEKPLPCPCCGAEVKVFHISRSELDQGYHVFCGRCGLQTEVESTPDKAVALWNRRMK